MILLLLLLLLFLLLHIFLPLFPLLVLLLLLLRIVSSSRATLAKNFTKILTRNVPASLVTG